MSEQIYEFKIGEFTCFSVNDGSRPFDELEHARSIYPDAPPMELQKAFDKLPTYGRVFCYNPLIVRTKDHQVLIDTGHGTAYEQKGQLLDVLKTAGIAAESIDVVFITHYHGDHINGLVNPDGSLAFPNARYVMGKEEWDSWMGKEPLHIDRDDEYINRTRNIFKLIEDKLKPVKLSQKIVPGVFAVAAFGHTTGHMGVLVQSKKQRLLHIADAAHTLLQVAHPEWSPHFDTDKEMAAQTRQRLFGYAVDDRLLVHGFHFPFPALGYLQRLGDGFTWQRLT